MATEPAHSVGRVVGSGAHLVRRFFGSLSRRPPTVADDVWVRSVLLPGEYALWARHGPVDRRHTIGVARRACAIRPTLTGASERDALAGILLHDVGKVDSALGTFARVLATLRGLALGERARLGDGRWARYLRHEEIGADLARAAGSPPETQALIGRTERAPRDLLAVLQAADDG